MNKTFEFAESEPKLYAEWRKLGVFAPDLSPNAEKPTYSITIPPPNVTGSLHMGHALCYTIQDILGRWKRMSGYDVLIQPGVDHGGISTQTVVEKEIAKEKLTRQELGRARFLERVDQWKEQYGARIVEQMQRLGCAFDWERERYTMDAEYSDAVLEHFVRLYDQGLIYRGARVINWCPRCRTALSDIEVEYLERETSLWHIRYDFADGNGSVTVATTRPETLLGDSAVAVNPNDPRYAGMQGRTLNLPLTDRQIPLIFDDYASMEFGTGAVKVTPAHDLNDFEAGRRHKLPQIVVIGEDGRMTAIAGDKYANLTREEAREAVEADLIELGLLVEKEKYRHSVGTCERCHTIIEPLLSEQWFVKMAGTTLVNRAIEVVADDVIRFVPERYKRVYIDWMENIRDWCISRQLWWGHRIPIFYAPDGRTTAAKSAEDAAIRLNNGDVPPVEATELRQDDDVLDTWFSSDLWPFATLGWPDQTPELARFYPTSVLVTSREIIYLWVARMIMMGVEFTDQIPFHDVYIYATVLDKQGRRMSKSLGNGIDPVQMIEKYGTDALRFSLVRLASKGQDIRFSEDRVPEARNFCTKIWNASRFVLMNLEDNPSPKLPENALFSIPERWILTRLQQTTERIETAFTNYDLDEACAALYSFFWNDYCDWFVELAKPALRQEARDSSTSLGMTSSTLLQANIARGETSIEPDSSTSVGMTNEPPSESSPDRQRVQFVLWHVLESALRLMHPIMPFISDEIWQSIPHDGATIALTEFPKADQALIDIDAAAQMETIIAAIRAIRNLRGELQITPSLALNAEIVADGAKREILKSNQATIISLARLETLIFAETPLIGEGVIGLPVESGVDIYIPLLGIVDMEKERGRLSAEIAKVEADLAKVRTKLANPMFIERGAPDIITKDRATEVELSVRLQKLESRKQVLGA